MNQLKYALSAEMIKMRHLSIVGITFIAFALGPVMGGLFMLLLQNPEIIPSSGILNTKMTAFALEVSWQEYMSLLSQVMGIGGIIVFGFAASFIFGREYTENTYSDLLSLPVSRTHIINAKFIVYIFWCLLLSSSNLILGFMIAGILNLPGWDMQIIVTNIQVYVITTLLTILFGTLVSFFALWSRGYLAPLGFLVITLIFAQIIPILGWGYYFPWSIPIIYCGAAGVELQSGLNGWSYIILIFISFSGYLSSQICWKYRDQA